MANIFATAEETLLARHKLPQAFGNDAFRPSYDGLGLANIAALPIHWLCPEAPSLSEEKTLPAFNPGLLGNREITEAWENWQNSAPINHVVLLLMDAFGYDQLQTLIKQGDTPGLASASLRPQSFFMPATSVFPSTTVTALASAANAYAPAQHGVMGTTIYHSQIGSLVNLIAWRPYLAPSSTSYSDTQLNPDTFIPLPNIYLRMEKAGVDVGIVNYYQFKKSGISRYTSALSQAGDSGYISYLTPADGFAQLRERILANYDKGKSFTSMYVPNVDSNAHRFGPLSSNYQAEVAALDFALNRELLQPLAGRSDVILLLIADHGQRCIDANKVLWLNDHPALTDLMFLPASGESRARYLHLKHGKEAAAMDYIQQHLGEDFLAVSQKEAIELGLFGLPGQSLSGDCQERIGDLVLIPRGDWICYKESSSGERTVTNVGVHGSLGRAEMLIPFLGYRF